MYTGGNPLGQGFQNRVTQYPDSAFIGLMSEIRNSVSVLYPIAPSYQSLVVAIGAVVANTDYIFRVENYELTVNSGTLSTADFRALVIEKLQEDSQFGAFFRISPTVGGDVQFVHRNPGAIAIVSVEGGNASVNAVNPVPQGILPLGRVLTLASTANLSGSLPSVQLIQPGAKPYGIGGIANHAKPRLWDYATQREVAGFAPGSVLSAMRSGSIYLPVEAECFAGSEVYYRDSAQGDLKTIGGISPTAGAGLVKMPGAQVVRQSERLSTGELAALVEFDILVGV